jgi:hypothetical protein
VGIFEREPIPSIAQLAQAERFLVGESVSWKSEPGRAVSWRPWDGVPAGRLLIVQSIYVHNAEPGQNLATLLLLDADGLDHGRFAPGGVTPVPIPSGGELSWTGELIVPPGWKVGVRFEQMAGGGHLCHWRYTAIET